MLFRMRLYLMSITTLPSSLQRCLSMLFKRCFRYRFITSTNNATSMSLWIIKTFQVFVYHVFHQQSCMYLLGILLLGCKRNWWLQSQLVIEIISLFGFVLASDILSKHKQFYIQPQFVCTSCNLYTLSSKSSLRFSTHLLFLRKQSTSNITHPSIINSFT